MKKICDVFHNAAKYISVLEKLTRLRNKKKKDKPWFNKSFKTARTKIPLGKENSQ